MDENIPPPTVQSLGGFAKFSPHAPDRDPGVKNILQRFRSTASSDGSRELSRKKKLEQGVKSFLQRIRPRQQDAGGERRLFRTGATERTTGCEKLLAMV